MIDKEIKELLDELPSDEAKVVKKGIDMWNNMEVFKMCPNGGRIDNDTLKLLLNNVIINTWINAKNYFKKNK